MKRKKRKNKKGRKRAFELIKESVRKDFIEAGGQDGRFATKVVPDKKKKYNRKKEKKVGGEE